MMTFFVVPDGEDSKYGCSCIIYDKDKNVVTTAMSSESEQVRTSIAHTIGVAEDNLDIDIVYTCEESLDSEIESLE